MNLYQYKAISRAGEQVSGEIEALEKNVVFDELDKLGLFPVDVQLAKKKKAQSSSDALPFLSSNPKPAQITQFTRELAMLLNAGLSLDKALGMLLNDKGAKKLKQLIEPILKSINDGKSFHDALSELGSVFPPVYISMVSVAEASGTLNVVLESLAEAREKDEKLRAKALSTMLYPGLLIFTAIGAVVIMLVYVVPSFKDLIQNANGDVPESSRIVIAASDWLIANGLFLIQAIAVSILVMPFLMRNPSLRQSMDNVSFRLPIISHIKRLALTIRFCRTMGTLLENGVDLPQAMNLTKNVLGNISAEKAVAEAGEALRKGQDFLDPLSRAKIFPEVVLNMLRVGEETGSLAKSSLFLANMFEEKLETSIQRIFTILEPVIIMIVSLFVAGIIISIIGSVLSINDLAA